MFEKKAEFKYITKNTTREELVEECRRLKNLICQLRHTKKKHRITKHEEKRKAAKHWKERFHEMKYDSYKKSQLIWGKNVHIERLRKKNRTIETKGVKRGYQMAMKKILVNHYKVKHVAQFLMKVHTVMEIYKLNFKEYSFLLWAGRYDFFTRKDFLLTIGDVDINFYKTLNGLMKRNLISVVSENIGHKAKAFSLTGTGVDMYNKIAKFTNKFLKSDTGTSGVRDNVQNAGSAEKVSIRK